MDDTQPLSTSASGKYSRENIVREKKIRKGRTRWNQFQEGLLSIDATLLHGPLLDFGSGVGYFVLEGLRRGRDIYGIDILPGKLERYRMLVDYTGSPPAWASRCTAGSGTALPFASSRFAAVSSWYVFEHIARPAPIIRELVRVTRPGGVVCIRAQDARNGWEGHCKIPWVPFLPEELEAAWIEEFGAAPEMRREVYDITQPQVISIFEELNCSVVIQADEPRVLVPNHWNLTTETEVRRQAREVKRALAQGQWQPQPENLYLFARKL